MPIPGYCFPIIANLFVLKTKNIHYAEDAPYAYSGERDNAATVTNVTKIIKH